jgi:hypothetical protein
MDDDDFDDRSSGPFCVHSGEAYDCDELCTCGHACSDHELVYDFQPMGRCEIGEACRRSGEHCACEKFVDAPEPPKPPPPPPKPIPERESLQVWRSTVLRDAVDPFHLLELRTRSWVFRDGEPALEIWEFANVAGKTYHASIDFSRFELTGLRSLQDPRVADYFAGKLTVADITPEALGSNRGTLPTAFVDITEKMMRQFGKDIETEADRIAADILRRPDKLWVCEPCSAGRILLSIERILPEVGPCELCGKPTRLGEVVAVRNTKEKS